ncbi:glutathione S-transferase family protein [Metapseudomonas lalkuanensis]|uniref:Glutathione S-transferase family protein n=1 Tax=Metapseudomonas lalkuanensis TaxID=2604832 RepID=A0A5J6QMP5_9GAMM|nr:glutathione S-transferase family protein [Pseudomonas lalkuanensis]QEY63637.1 glutathione S-transferase family protein [Pseudomonas lalkuanensis]
MSLTLYGAPLSPFVRKVRLYLLEKGLDYQLEIVSPFSQPSWFRELSPLGRIPALRDGDMTLADSSVICQYLEEKHPHLAPLYGRDAEERARVRWLEKYCDYEVAPLATFGVFRNRTLKPSMGQSCDEAIVQAALVDKLPPHFDYLEKTLGTAEYFVGERLTIADLAFTTQMINMEHGGERLDAGCWPQLAAHYARMTARESAQAVLPGEQKILAKLAGRA